MTTSGVRLNIQRWLATAVLGIAAAGIFASGAEARPQGLHGKCPYVFIGQARAIDGHTLSVNGQPFRLQGIDAPTPQTRCLDIHHNPWPCGEEAQDRLAALIDGARVACYGRRMRTDGSVLGICYSYGYAPGGESLNAVLVREGWAKPDPDQGKDYDTLARKARRDRSNIWSGDYLEPGVGPADKIRPRTTLGLTRHNAIPGGASF